MDPINVLTEAEKSLYPAIVSCISEAKTKKYNEDRWSLQELNDWRLTILPQSLKQRQKEHKKPFVTSDELVLLMDWKLAFGKFRPMLPKLIRSNSDDEVKEATEQGFSSFIQALEAFDPKKLDDSKNLQVYYSAVEDALKEISVLKGVGPATASLVLSLLTENVQYAPPFFSDEAFMYFVVDRARPETKIKYNVKEYVQEYLPVFYSILRTQKDLKMDVIERGGWSLKMMDLFSIDKLAEVELPDVFENAVLHHFESEVEIPIPEVGPKRKKVKVSK